MKKIKILTSLSTLSILGTGMTALSGCNNPKINECTITLDVGEHGTISQKSINVSKNKKWFEIKNQIPQPTCAKGWSFKEWTLNGSPINDDYEITGNITITCAYNAVFTINFEATAHGQLHGFVTCDVIDGTLWKDVNKPSYAADQGYIFAGWWNDEHYMYDDTVIHSDLTITADFELGDFYVFYDKTDGGTLSGHGVTIVQNGALFGDIYKPTPTQNPGYHFTGWYNGDILMTDSTPINSNITITAKFEPGEINIIEFTTDNPDHCKLAFNKFEFVGSITWDKILRPELTIDKGYIPTGWYKSTGEKIYDYTEFNKSTTVIIRCTNDIKWEDVYNYTVFRKPGTTEDVVRVNSIKPECVNQLDEYSIPRQLGGAKNVVEVSPNIFRNISHIKKIDISEVRTRFSSENLIQIPANFVSGCTSLEYFEIKDAHAYETDNHNPYLFKTPQQAAEILKKGTPELTYNGSLNSDNFFKESWTNIINWSNEGGLDLLKQKFDVTTFIGKKKEIVINNHHYLAVVIGENHDELSDGSGNKAPLTFQIMHLISDTSGNNLLTNATSHQQIFANLEKSKITTSENVNWFGSTETRDVYTMLTDNLTGTPELLNNIKQVNKKYGCAQASVPEPYIIKTEPSYLFCVNSTEICGGGVSGQGTQYSYWTNKQYESRKLTDINGKVCSWRLTDTSQEDDNRLYYINELGQLSLDPSTGQQPGRVIPLSVCFCI